MSLRARISEYNFRPDGGRDYLSVGETELDVLYWVMFALFSGLTAAWFAVLARSRDAVQRVHQVMAALVVCKTVTLLAQARGCGGAWGGGRGEQGLAMGG